MTGQFPVRPNGAPRESAAALTMDPSVAALDPLRAARLAPTAGMICHTPQPTPPVDDDDDDEDENDRGSDGGNIDPDDDEGWSNEDDDDEDNTLWSALGHGVARRARRS